jgi:DNA-binding transcriptional LysR family regulator
LDKHRIIIYGGDSRPPVRYVNWLIEAGANGRERQPIMAVNNLYAIYRAVESGLGIAAMPDFMERETSDLVRILPELQGPEIEAFFVYPEELRTSKRIAVFRDFLLRKVAEGKNGAPPPR